MTEPNHFYAFVDNTKFICIIIGVALLVTVFTTIAPVNLGSINISIGKLIAIILLMYAFLKNCKESTNLVNTIPDLFSNPKLNNIKNNTLLSYILSVTILVLIIYISYTILF
jgi:hypothetical protein